MIRDEQAPAGLRLKASPMEGGKQLLRINSNAGGMVDCSHQQQTGDHAPYCPSTRGYGSRVAKQRLCDPRRRRGTFVLGVAGAVKANRFGPCDPPLMSGCPVAWSGITPPMNRQEQTMPFKPSFPISIFGRDVTPSFPPAGIRAGRLFCASARLKQWAA